jgi:nicotinamidase/pyrazinamidase
MFDCVHPTRAGRTAQAYHAARRTQYAQRPPSRRSAPDRLQGSPGADFHPDLEVTKAQMIVRKGFHTGIDSYSAFRENDRMTRTGLDGYLKARGFTKLVFCGLALDYCVAWSAIDARQAGFDVAVVVEATAAIDLDDSRKRMMSDMRRAGINLNATA